MHGPERVRESGRVVSGPATLAFGSGMHRNLLDLARRSLIDRCRDRRGSRRGGGDRQ